MKSYYKLISRFVKKTIDSQWFNHCINFLTIINCLSVIVVLIIEFIELSIINREYTKLTKDILKESIRFDLIEPNDLNETLSNFIKYDPTIPDFKIAYSILSIIVLTILCLFLIEIVIKLIFLPSIFKRRKFEIAEALIVFISFVLNLSLFFEKVRVLSVISLITLIR
ncbi:unnamed protein product [Brachionus calyciflorus]|uniref:Uncharacterized protein n=1 Tax=Brachionus calyciflorus TaxID=104777 RepID=A0A813TNQ8_9BILA|nr:unnamed protein product [Brachionus calyciflorus]